MSPVDCINADFQLKFIEESTRIAELQYWSSAICWLITVSVFRISAMAMVGSSNTDYKSSEPLKTLVMYYVYAIWCSFPCKNECRSVKMLKYYLKTRLGSRALSAAGPRCWNRLPSALLERPNQSTLLKLDSGPICSFIHSFILATSIAPLKVLYYSEAVQQCIRPECN